MSEREELSVEPNKRTRRMEGYQLPRRPYSPDFWKKKKQTAVLISGSNQVLIPENVVETLVKITGEDWTPMCFFCEYDQLWNMPTLYCLFMAMNNCLLYIHMDL
jgi:hypothetical protein